MDGETNIAYTCNANSVTLLLMPLTHFQPTFHFYTPSKQNISGFLIFSGGLKVER